MTSPDNKSLSERDICTKYVTPAIERGGWDVQVEVRENVHLTKGRVAVPFGAAPRGLGPMPPARRRPSDRRGVQRPEADSSRGQRFRRWATVFQDAIEAPEESLSFAPPERHNPLGFAMAQAMAETARNSLDVSDKITRVSQLLTKPTPSGRIALGAEDCVTGRFQDAIAQAIEDVARARAG